MQAPVDPMQAGSGLTLGQAANPQPQPQPAPGTGGYIDQYLQMMDALQQKIAPLKKPLQHDPPAPGLLESLGTFGMANLKHMADTATTREQNYANDSWNRALDLHAADMALKATDAQATAAGLAGRANLANQRMLVELMRFQQQLQEAEHKRGREKVIDEYHGSIGVPTPGQLEGAEATNSELVPIPSGPNQGRFRLQPKPGGGWLPPAPGSPMDAELRGGASPAQPAAGRQAGESPADYAARRKAEQTTKAETSKQDAVANAEMERNAKIVEDFLTSPKFDMAKAQVLAQSPLGSSVNAPRAWLQRKMGGGGAAYLKQATTAALPALRAMEGGAKNMRLAANVLGGYGLSSQLEGLASGTMTQAEADQFKRTTLERIQRIREAVRSGTTTATQSTPTTPGSLGTPRRLSSGKLILEEP